MDESRELTCDEVRDRFLEQVEHIIDYWKSGPLTAESRVEGVAHSILVLLDGGTELPGFAVIPDPHPDDRPYHAGRGQPWYPEPPCDLSAVDIAGSLHELLAMRRRKD